MIVSIVMAMAIRFIGYHCIKKTKKAIKKIPKFWDLFGGPCGIRTHDPLLAKQVL